MFSLRRLERVRKSLLMMLFPVLLLVPACKKGNGDDMLFVSAALLLGSNSGRGSVPIQPTGLTATGGNGQIMLSWTAVPGATAYNVYWGASAGISTASGTKIAGVTFPYTHTGRTNGTDYYYIITAVNAGGEGQASAEATAYPYLSLLKTYQTQCWDAAGALISCTGTGQDGEYQVGRAADFSGPTQHSTYTVDYTTTDNATGFVWKSCAEGLSGAKCATGTASVAFWLTARDMTCPALNSANGGAGYAGRADWRLPTVEELETLINFSAFSPATFAWSFPATVQDFHWSAGALDISNAWGAHFLYGHVYAGLKDSNGYVRCVSGLPVSRAPFIDNGDGTVTDRGTGLIWQKCSGGQNNNASCTGTATTPTWANAVSYCNGLMLAGRTWRLPNVNELKSIVDRTRANPSIDTNAFPSTAADYYWSSSSWVPATATAWAVKFLNGYVLHPNKGINYYVRCVATGQ